MVDVREGCLLLRRIVGDGLEVPIILRGKIVGLGREKRNERTDRIII